MEFPFYTISVTAHNGSRVGGMTMELDIDASGSDGPVIVAERYNRDGVPNHVSAAAIWGGLDLAQLAGALPRPAPQVLELQATVHAEESTEAAHADSADATATPRRACKRCGRVVAVARSGKLAPHKNQPRDGEPCEEPQRGARPGTKRTNYREMPADFPDTLHNWTGTPSTLAEQYGVPRHTIASWTRRVRHADELSRLPVREAVPTPTPAPATPIGPSPAFVAPQS